MALTEISGAHAILRRNANWSASHARHEAHSGGSSSLSGDKDRSIKDLLTNFGRSMLFIGFTVAVVAAGNQVLQARHDLAVRGLRVALVMLEYNELPVCGTSPIAFQVPLEPGHYSVARPSDHGVSFSTVACPTRGGKE